ncbi:hypothetical protein BDF19DRAFT_451543 [Syncephalis fuscata]|nr:hypothetical protein BDF19DRAFT_451543 [Syncephalis fuscata]
MRNKMLSILPQSMVSIRSYYNPEFNHGPATDMKGLNKTNPEPYKTAFRSSKSTVNTYRQDPPNNDISQRIPSILINGEQPYLSTADAHASEISKLKTMIAAQMKQVTVMSDQLAMLESNLSTNNSTILLDKSTLDNTCLSNTSMARYSEPFVSSRSAAAFETRLSNIEAFQSRLGTFYLSSDLFRND